MITKKLTEMNKEELIEQIKLLKKRKKFGLVWEDKPELVAEQCKNELPVLEEVKEKAVVKNEEKTNILIEGDNYHALSVLNYTHKGKIDVIYIDPPYNTGNKDFIYNDRYVEKEDSFRHSKWLSFMEKRLKLARNLLSQNGVIFISIDDNEQANLKILCDEVFGEENFLSLNVIETGEVFGTKAAHADKTFIKVKDYVFVYAKNQYKAKGKQPLYDTTKELYDSHFNTIVFEDLNKVNIINYLNKEEWVVKLFNKFETKLNAKNISKIMNFSDKFKKFIYDDLSNILYTDQPFTKKIDQETLDKYDTGSLFKYDNKILFKTATGSIRMMINFKDSLRLSDNFESVYTRSTIRGDLWKGFHTDMRNVQDEGGVDFKNGKKPTRLIKQLLKWFNSSSSIILDFFAGSGTTGHAVLELNKQDGGNRQFILCTNNENGIAENVTYQRISKVINGYSHIEGMPANLRYFRTSFVPRDEVSDETRTLLVQKAADMICVKENTFEEVVTNKHYKIYSDGKKATGILYDIDKMDEFKEKLNTTKKKASIYVFTLTNETYEEDFRNLKVRHKLKPIPESILEVYRKIFN